MKYCALLFLFLCIAGEGLAEEPNDARPADQTYLTYPEWFLVFSPDEYAYFLNHHNAYDFPYFGHLSQFWEGYRVMYNKTLEKGYQLNMGYHVMIMVIGLSTTVEYVIKSIYGNTIGRLAALTQTHGRTSEQEYGAEVAQAYADFIKDRPWYKFPFWDALKGIYTENSFLGYDFIRKTERKFALSCEYGVKFIYAKIIGFFTSVGYDEASLETQVLVIKNGVKTKTFFARYDQFKQDALLSAKQGYNFIEIAGNNKDTPILVSIVTDNLDLLKAKHCLLDTKILSNPIYHRCLFEREVGMLSEELRSTNYQITNQFLPSTNCIKLEHIFDY